MGSILGAEMGCGASQPDNAAEAEAAKPAADPAKPAADPAKPAADPAKPAAEKPAEEAAALDTASTEFALMNITLGLDEKAKVEKQIQEGNAEYLKNNAEEMAIVEKIFAACDADANGSIDKDEMVARYGKQAGHMLKEFDLNSGKSISKAEFIAVLDDKYQKDAKRTAKWVKFLSKDPKPKDAPKETPQGELAASDDNWLFRIRVGLPDAEDPAESAEAVAENLQVTMETTDGKVGSKEWGQTVFQNKDMLAKYFGGSSMKEIASAFDKMDTNSSDSLTWDEFVGAASSETATTTTADAARGWALVRNVVAIMQTEDGQEELKAVFDKIDRDDNGKVSCKEWGRFAFKNKDLLKKYLGGGNMRDISQMFNKLDKDNNDSLSWEEFSAGSKAMGDVTKQAAVTLRERFKQLDATGDGLVDKQELGASLKNDAALGELITKAGMNPQFYVLEQIDGNQDGKISWNEFKNALHDDKFTPGKRRPRSV